MIEKETNRFHRYKENINKILASPLQYRQKIEFESILIFLFLFAILVDLKR